MRLLPYYQSSLKELSLLQTVWASILNPVVTNPVVQGTILPNVTLVNGTTTINHKLGRKLQGWIPVRYHGAFADIYDNQDSNSMPELTLSLTTNNATVVDLYVF